MTERERRRGIGPGAVTLILVILVVTLGILSVLAAISARNDSYLTARSLEMTEVYYRLSAQAELHYQELDSIVVSLRRDGSPVTAENLMAGMTMDGDLIHWMEKDENGNGMVLSCTVQLQPEDSMPRLKWVERAYWNADNTETEDEEWN